MAMATLPWPPPPSFPACTGVAMPPPPPPSPGPHQDELPIVGHLPGPARLGSFTLEQPLLTHHLVLVLTLPPGQALQKGGQG